MNGSKCIEEEEDKLGLIHLVIIPHFSILYGENAMAYAAVDKRNMPMSEGTFY